MRQPLYWPLTPSGEVPGVLVSPRRRTPAVHPRVRNCCSTYSASTGEHIGEPELSWQLQKDPGGTRRLILDSDWFWNADWAPTTEPTTPASTRR